MKHALLAALLIACGSCATLPSRTVQDVLGAPETYRGKPVSVCGWFQSSLNFCAVSAVPVDPMYFQLQATIWITPISDICVPLRQFEDPQAGWAVVTGTFLSGGGFGHSLAYKRALQGATVKFVHRCDT
jgi:hypothetical protein